MRFEFALKNRLVMQFYSVIFLGQPFIESKKNSMVEKLQQINSEFLTGKECCLSKESVNCKLALHLMLRVFQLLYNLQLLCICYSKSQAKSRMFVPF